MTRFVKNTTILQFNTDPNRPAEASLSLHQVRGLDSSGNVYTYTRSALQRGRWRLVFPRVTDSLLGDIASFVLTVVDGTRHAFTWYDHGNTARTVRLATPEFSQRNVGPNRHQVEIELIEDV